MDRSKLVKMRVVNFGCIDNEGLEIALDNIVCLVGPNNAGKSTALRAYEAAVTQANLTVDDINVKARTVGSPTTVELWIHIPKEAENIDEKWKEQIDGLLLVRSKWEWPSPGKPIRTTWDPVTQEYATDGKAAGLDNVFNSRLPKPFRIESLQGPLKEHSALLALILEPILKDLTTMLQDEESDLFAQVLALQEAVRKPITAFKEQLAEVQEKVNTSYRRVFNSSQIRLSVDLVDWKIDPTAAIKDGSRVCVVEPHGQTSWEKQGTGSQRALFWSMLEVRSELNRISEEKARLAKNVKEKHSLLKKAEKSLITLKKEDAKRRTEEEIERLRLEIQQAEKSNVPPPDSFLPGYMLLIDEPETALHPSAVRAAKAHIYSLAASSGWQVMLSTHHPAFVDPLEDHTTIVRLHRPETHASPNTYRAETMAFSEEDRENLKSLLAFDVSVAEMFFGPRVIVVEGDTELAAFSAVMEENRDEFPAETRPLLIRARGKATIPLLVRMLTHFKVDFAVLHDIDSPRIEKGTQVNSAFTVNTTITNDVARARKSGLDVVHRLSCPQFEKEHGMSLPSKDKPFQAWKAVRTTDVVRNSVLAALRSLNRESALGSEDHLDGRHFKRRLSDWIATNVSDDPAYSMPLDKEDT